MYLLMFQLQRHLFKVVKPTLKLNYRQRLLRLEFDNDEFPILDKVLFDPEIVLFVNVSVVSFKTSAVRLVK